MTTWEENEFRYLIPIPIPILIEKMHPVFISKFNEYQTFVLFPSHG